MRVASDHKHPDYKPEMMGATVCLDGCIVSHVLCADEEAGQIVAAAKDAKGDFIHENGAIKVEILIGHVRIYPPQRSLT